MDFTGSEEDILSQIRSLVTILPANNEDDMSYSECTDDLNRVCSDLENYAGATDLALAQISDDNFFLEVKKELRQVHGNRLHLSERNYRRLCCKPHCCLRGRWREGR